MQIKSKECYCQQAFPVIFTRFITVTVKHIPAALKQDAECELVPDTLCCSADLNLPVVEEEEGEKTSLQGSIPSFLFISIR